MDALGDIDGGGQNFVGDTVRKPHTVPQLDPLAHIPDTPTPTSCESKVSATMGPGCYGSMDIKGPVTLAPGTYYVKGGDLTINAQASVTGENVTIVMTGTNGEAGDIKIKRSEEHTTELTNAQFVCRLLLSKEKTSELNS